MITVLIPAHNEQPVIADAIESLRAQTLQPDRIVVVADNCTDQTSRIAREMGCEVFETVDNVDKKAGALNQAISTLSIYNGDYLLVQDADSRIVPEFVSTAVAHINAGVDAVGGVFMGDPLETLNPVKKMLSYLQQMEYVRYARDLGRTGKVWVLTGTATMLSGYLVNRLLGGRGYVYEPSALTEDMELSLAVKSLGLTLASPPECIVYTETMPNFRTLWNQRLRWQRGALENLRTYGVRSRVTWPYLAQQGLMAFGTIALFLYLLLTVIIIATGQFGLSPFWLAVGAVFLVERVVTVWKMPIRYRIIASTMVLDMMYDMFLQAVLIRATVDTVLSREQVWTHDTQETISCT